MADIDTSKPHPARVYDWLLGGKDHYEVDAEVGRKCPDWFRKAAQQNRDYMERSTRWFTRVYGITQFLDIGTGVPTEPNLHQVAQSVDPSCRVVYADNDPLVCRQSEALLVGTPQGATEYIEADVREPARILNEAGTVLNFDEPIVLSLIAIMHFVLDRDDPYGIVATLVESLPPGSILNLTHTSTENMPGYEEQIARSYNSSIESQSRTRAEVARFHTDSGLTFIGSDGVVPANEWSPKLATPPQDPSPSAVYVAASLKER